MVRYLILFVNYILSYEMKILSKQKGSFCSTGNSCADLGRIHNGGPYGCNNSNTEYYGWLIARCLRRESPYENIDNYPIAN